MNLKFKISMLICSTLMATSSFGCFKLRNVKKDWFDFLKKLEYYYRMSTRLEGEALQSFLKQLKQQEFHNAWFERVETFLINNESLTEEDLQNLKGNKSEGRFDSDEIPKPVLDALVKIFYVENDSEKSFIGEEDRDFNVLKYKISFLAGKNYNGSIIRNLCNLSFSDNSELKMLTKAVLSNLYQKEISYQDVSGETIKANGLWFLLQGGRFHIAPIGPI